MWIRVRLDINWLDLWHALLGSLTPNDHTSAQVGLEHGWSGEKNDALACLSVRTAFDLLLRALDLPPGTEVLFSAVTIPDMVQVARTHNLVPVPVDVEGSDFHVDLVSLKQATTAQSKVLVLAHLFGARPDVTPVLDIAREKDLFVVEDCAQAWCGAGWRGSEDVDASLFSFGAIKTATSLGGALARVRSESLLARMRDLQATYPVQSQREYAFRVFRFTVLKAISTRAAFACIAAMGKRLGRNVDEVLGSLTRGFSDDELLTQLRRQPCAGLLKLMRRRLESYDLGRIDRRIENARRLIARLQLAESQPHLTDERHTFWFFPYQTEDFQELISRLAKHGFDATRRGRLEVVPPPSDRPELRCRSAVGLLEHTVLLPCYPEMPPRAIERMGDVIAGGPRKTED